MGVDVHGDQDTKAASCRVGKRERGADEWSVQSGGIRETPNITMIKLGFFKIAFHSFNIFTSKKLYILSKF